MKMLKLARWTTTVVLLAAAMPAQALTLPFGIGGGETAMERSAAPAPAAEPPVRYAQAGDPIQRINQLEEDNRRLNGKVEELSFQVLQLQEQLRKTQEDNEFRFQEIEGKGTPGKRSDAAPAAGAAAPTATAQLPSQGSAPATAPSAAPNGDSIGDLLGEGGLDTAGLGAGTAPAARPSPGSSTVASVKPNGAGEMYDLAYNYMLAGDYQLAETSFRQYADTYPDAKDVPDARYWLGESLFQQQKYTDAAEVFLTAQKSYPKNAKAPEMMLKLGMSLAKLDNRETACVTFKEVSKRYPQMSANVKKKLQSEAAASNC